MSAKKECRHSLVDSIYPSRFETTQRGSNNIPVVPFPAHLSPSPVTHSRQEDFWIERALVTHPDWPSKRRIYRPRRRRLRFISLHTSDRPYSRSITLREKKSRIRVFTADGEEEKTTAGVVNAKNICCILTLRLRIWIFSILLVPSARLLKQRSEVSPAS